MFVRIASTSAFALAVLLVAGCAPLPMADAGLDAQAKTFATSPDHANVYVYRDQRLGAAIKMSVIVDNRQVGLTMGKTYLLLRLEPGQHTIRSQEQLTTLLTLEVEAGKNYFVWQEVTHTFGSFVYHSQLHTVIETTGRAGVNECELVLNTQ